MKAYPFYYNVNSGFTYLIKRSYASEMKLQEVIIVNEEIRYWQGCTDETLERHPIESVRV